MKTYNFVFVFILFIGMQNSDLFAQSSNKTVIEKLQECNWKQAITETAELIYEFSSVKDLRLTAIFPLETGNKTYVENTHYYLTDTVDEIFDENKVGKNQNGNYLTYKGNKNGRAIAMRIIEITPTELKYENIYFNIIVSMYPITK